VGAGTWESHHAITALMYRYTEYIDAADFDAVGELFAHGRITTAGMEGATVGHDAVRDLYRNTNTVHAGGTLRTRHYCTNVLLDIDEEAGTAMARSSFLVVQATTDLPLQPIVAGRYRDRFERVAGEWRFAEREMEVTHVGDTREHLSFDLAAFLDR
jgi:3-phenylpropionate/cinnamic acid dioxygenase small subunit